MAFNDTCVAEVRTCTNGTLGGSFMFAQCFRGEGNNCTLELASGVAVIVPHDTLQPYYKSSLVPCGSQCESELRYCDNGIINGTFTEISCSQECACMGPDGVSIPHGEGKIYYQTDVVGCVLPCVTQKRVCYGGALNGSYVYTHCGSCREGQGCSVRSSLCGDIPLCLPGHCGNRTYVTKIQRKEREKGRGKKGKKMEKKHLFRFLFFFWLSHCIVCVVSFFGRNDHGFAICGNCTVDSWCNHDTNLCTPNALPDQVRNDGSNSAQGLTTDNIGIIVGVVAFAVLCMALAFVAVMR